MRDYVEVRDGGLRMQTGPGVRSRRGLRVHTGAAAIPLACRSVLMFGQREWSVIFG